MNTVDMRPFRTGRQGAFLTFVMSGFALPCSLLGSFAPRHVLGSMSSRHLLMRRLLRLDRRFARCAGLTVPGSRPCTGTSVVSSARAAPAPRHPPRPSRWHAAQRRARQRSAARRPHQRLRGKPHRNKLTYISANFLVCTCGVGCGYGAMLSLHLSTCLASSA